MRGGKLAVLLASGVLLTACGQDDKPAAMPQTSITRSASTLTPDPCARGSKTVNTASSKCRIGKTLAIRASQDPLSTGKNVPEMKRIGNRSPLTIAGDAVATGISAVIARPRLQKQNAPTTRVRTNAPYRPGKLTP